MTTRNSAGLEMALDSGQVSKLFPLLGYGFSISTPTGVSIAQWYDRYPELPAGYLTEKVQTIFLNGVAVDDVQTACISDGATLALSAAMPGVVGAIFRKGGRYAPLRCRVSPAAGGARQEEKTGWLTLKLFNLVAREIGPFFLKRGVCLPGSRLSEFFDTLPASFWSGCRRIIFNGAAVDARRLNTLLTRRSEVCLKAAEAQ